jgi:hypothetical protein
MNLGDCFVIVKGAVIECGWRRGADIHSTMRWIGFSLFCIEFGFHFKPPIYDCDG